VPAVVIAASHLADPLRKQLAAEGELITFADTEAIQALQAILEKQPNLIVLERLFAATPRGAALINRIKTDPLLTQAELRVMSHTGDYVRQISRPAVAAAAAATTETRRPVAAAPSAPSAPVADPPKDLSGVDWGGTRRADRTTVKPGIEIQLDGNPGTIVDVSTIGAQVLSPTILRPNQKVRVNITDDEVALRFRGTIAWAKFELASGRPVYRAGVEFADSDGAALERSIGRVKQ